MPIVVRQRDRWSLHDAVREWIAADFQNRKPLGWQETRRKALAALKARSVLHPSLQSEIGFELIFLHDSPFIRSFCFQLDNQLALHPVRESDLERLEWLYLTHLRANCGADPADPHLAPLIGPLWRLQPESFLGLWQDRLLVAFIACHRLEGRVKEILSENPITRPAVTRVPADEAAYIMCLYGVEPDMEPMVNGSMARAIPMLLKEKARYVNLLPPMDWEAYLSLLGYERFPEADSASTGGTPHRAYLMDLTRENLVDKVERTLPMVAGQGETAIPVLPDSAPSTDRPREWSGITDVPFEETVKRVSRFLKRYHKLPQYPEYARDFLFLLPPASCGLNDEAAVQALMARSQTILERLSGGNPEERRISRILRYAYIQKIGTHEATAEFLDIPVPSYFRYLRSAIRRFAFEWIHEA